MHTNNYSPHNHSFTAGTMALVWKLPRLKQINGFYTLERLPYLEKIKGSNISFLFTR